MYRVFEVRVLFNGSVMVVLVVVGERMLSHDHDFEEEEHKDDHQNDSLDPGVLGDGASQTGIAQCFVGRCEELGGCQ